MNLITKIEHAYNRIHRDILDTPLLYSKWLSNLCGGKVYLKLENEQITGSFKARGSLNKLKWLKEQQNLKLPVTASSGNHGLGFARSLDLLQMEGKVFLPKNAVSSKVDKIRNYKADLEFYGEDTYTTEQYARSQADKKGWCYVSPYNNKEIIAGQGTIAIEILEKIEQPNYILATVGGGGLISGIAAYMKEKSPDTKIIGCQPENSPEMAVSVRAGKYQEVESKPTLSDGSAGGFEPDSITFDICKKWVDDFILVSEGEIKKAIFKFIKYHNKIMEGAAAVSVASLQKEPERFTDQTTVIVISGANISPKIVQKILNTENR